MAEEEKDEKNGAPEEESNKDDTEAISETPDEKVEGAEQDEYESKSEAAASVKDSEESKPDGQHGRGRAKTDLRGQGSHGRPRRGYFRRKVCRLCVNKINAVDYKDVDLLKKFVTDRGKMLPRRMTGTCAKHQRIVAAAVKRARMVALLPYVTK
jgi:small subunit ribosomal protein S18